jgi:NADH-quinone oxidoreductase subunit G
MAALVKLTIDGKSVEVPAGTLVIHAAKTVGIEIPAFCYYEGLALQAACRMCLVEVEKAPKLLTACTLPVQDGMVVHTDSPKVAEARKAMLELLLTNHPLDCPVCDKGGECELQDMTFRYGAGESRFLEQKVHVPEKQFSPLVYFDAPRCILCYRCVRICDEGLGVKALGVINRGVYTEIGPNAGDHLECDECGMCIDICPVGALTSGKYRYRTRPWEMEHIATICTHCADGCKTTLGVRNGAIIRANNRNRSGINGEFLCIKGRFGFDFTEHAERLRTPLVRNGDRFEPVNWAQAIALVARRFREIRDRGGRFGVIGSSHTTNEENFYLQKFARQALGTANIDHHRTGDVAALVDALAGRAGAWATSADLYQTKAALVIAADLAQQHPLVAFQLRANWRHHGLRLYAVTPGPVREDQYAVRSLRAPAEESLAAVESLAGELKREAELTVIFGDAIRGEAVHRLVAFCDSLGIPVKYVCLVDYSNSRGAADMGLLPDLLPGYRPAPEPGLALPEMLADPALEALWVVGANPLKNAALASETAFVVVQELFLTETARRADVVLPAASAYEKSGTVTNVCGEVQRLTKALSVPGTKSDLEIIGMIARAMGAEVGPAQPEKVFEEIRTSVAGYNVPLPVLATGGAAQAVPSNGRLSVAWRPELIRSARDTLFTSGSLGRYSRSLNIVIESPGELYRA